MAKRTIKSYSVHTARFLKYFWPFFNIMHEKIKHPLKTSGPFDTEQLIEDLKV